MNETEKFCQETDEQFALLMNQENCRFHPRGEPFDLWDRDHETRVTAVSVHPCFHIPDFDQFLSLSKQSRQSLFTSNFFKKCADHVVFQYDRGENAWKLHILEMKTTIGKDTWLTAVRQFHGAMLRAFAIGGIMRIHGFASVHTSCSFMNEKSMAENKPAPGKPAPRNPWEQETIRLKYFPYMEVSNTPIRLDRNKRGQALL